MNSFLTPMTEIITERKGTIDKYIGDCIMAFWNAPLDDPDHVRNAVQAAQAMRRKLVELNRLWQAEPAYQVFLPVRIGLGINTGECVVGNFGSQQHFDYSLLGDPVNLASRLEGLGKVYGIDLVIGEETAQRLGDPALIEAVKGKSEPAASTRSRRSRLPRSSSPASIRRCWERTGGRIGPRRCACWTTVGSPPPAFSPLSTIFTGGASPGSRSKPRRPIGTACSPPRRSEVGAIPAAIPGAIPGQPACRR